MNHFRFIEDYKASAGAFGRFGSVGVDVDLTKRLTGFIDYHYVKGDSFDLDRTGGGAGGFAETTQNGDFDIDAFTIGIRYSFK